VYLTEAPQLNRSQRDLTGQAGIRYCQQDGNMKTTQYFEYRRRRPDRVQIRNEWIQYVNENPQRIENQSDGRIRKWAKIEEVDKYLRIILLEDG